MKIVSEEQYKYFLHQHLHVARATEISGAYSVIQTLDSDGNVCAQVIYLVDPRRAPQYMITKFGALAAEMSAEAWQAWRAEALASHDREVGMDQPQLTSQGQKNHG